MRFYEIEIKGIVQGVGFRPFIYNYAKSQGFKGFVKNSSSGVIVVTDCDDIVSFVSFIKNNSPTLARIYSIEVKELEDIDINDFSIQESAQSLGFTHLSPDIAVCKDCLNELSDPKDRRYLYPFINCINCGPRYSIIKKVPYDRENTTMAKFQMCDGCSKEYNDPTNRRFHAQPNACPTCGPKISLYIEKVKVDDSNEEILRKTIDLLKAGAIVAIKGIGGFHLACDAFNKDSLIRLRHRKKRINKPFALMSPNISSIKKFCKVSDYEASILLQRGRPIVLLNKLKDLNLPEEIAPHNNCFGFMLPYTPLHYLIFYYPTMNIMEEDSENFSALVMTSGNFSEEPIIKDNEEALTILSQLSDAILLHDRDIYTRVDDSVIKVYNSKSVFIRRARGFIPQTFHLNQTTNDILACGADIKNSFVLIKDADAILSHHIGDMENLETIVFYQESFQKLASVYNVSPVAVAFDMHPAYHSARWAQSYIDGRVIFSLPVQHHYAHIASVMAEKGINEKVIGIAFDGNGYGSDGKLWGSEFLISDLDGFERFAHFKYIPLPGGEMAIKEPWRCALSYLKASYEDYTNDQIINMMEDIGFLKTITININLIRNLLKIMDNHGLSPLSSGAGRLFDAVSALLGLCYINTFEGEAPIALESILEDDKSYSDLDLYYPYEIIKEGITKYFVDFSQTIKGIVNDIKEEKNRALISHKFHSTVVNVIITMTKIIRDKTAINTVALSGGVFQNKYLLENATNELCKNGFKVFFNEEVPPNDAGISLGQAYILKHRLRR
ncbi:MAG: carbamoyltransferase HypF [Thermodesulfovibrionales bacterium]|nr:carbamoyltransferase HypF [Thermodesulfovibrionales bacterium]